MTQDKPKYKKFDYGPMETWDKHLFRVPDVVYEETGVREVPGKRFGKEDLGLEYMDFSINKLAAGMELPFVHTHRNQEELYFCIKGHGEIYVDGEIVEIEDGSVVRVSQNTMRTLRNTSLNEPLYYLCFRAQDGKIQEIPIDVPEPEMFDWDEVSYNEE